MGYGIVCVDRNIYRGADDGSMESFLLIKVLFFHVHVHHLLCRRSGWELHCHGKLELGIIIYGLYMLRLPDFLLRCVTLEPEQLTSMMVFSQDLAFLVGSANVTVFLAVSGGFVPFPYIEDWISWLQWISPIKYSFQAFTWSLLGGTSSADLLEQLELDTPSSVSSNIGILIGFFALCAAGSIFALSRQKEVR